MGLLFELILFFVLFRKGHFHNVVQLDVENENIVSTLSNVVHVNVEIHNVDSTLFDVVPRRNIPSTNRQHWNNVEMFAGIEVLEYLEEVISSEALKLKH